MTGMELMEHSRELYLVAHRVRVVTILKTSLNLSHF